jgi:hypothetical protein
VQGTIGRGKTCRPPSCDCLDLGDVPGDFELPRACEVTVHVTFSGKGTSSSGPFEKGAALVDASVTGEVSGGPMLPGDAALCGGSPCGGGTADAAGNVTFVVPVVGDTPEIQVRTQYTVKADGDTHYYSGSLSVSGCARDQASLAGRVELKADHATLDDLGDFIASLGDGPSPTTPGGTVGDEIDRLQPPEAPSCACRQAAPASAGTTGFSLATVALTVLTLARRRRACASPAAPRR